MAEGGSTLNKEAVLRIFRCHVGDLYQAINSRDVYFLSWMLYSKFLITQSVAKSAQNPYKEEGQQATALLDGVQSKLSSSPDDILTFLSVLDQCRGSGLQVVAEEMHRDLAAGKTACPVISQRYQF